jgi:hypothetical protein
MYVLFPATGQLSVNGVASTESNHRQVLVFNKHRNTAGMDKSATPACICLSCLYRSLLPLLRTRLRQSPTAASCFV